MSGSKKDDLAADQIRRDAHAEAIGTVRRWANGANTPFEVRRTIEVATEWATELLAKSSTSIKMDRSYLEGETIGVLSVLLKYRRLVITRAAFNPGTGCWYVGVATDDEKIQSTREEATLALALTAAIMRVEELRGDFVTEVSL